MQKKAAEIITLSEVNEAQLIESISAVGSSKNGIPTFNYYHYSIINLRTDKQQIILKPYDIQTFLTITLAKKNFEDMKSYTEFVIQDFRKKLID